MIFLKEAAMADITGLIKRISDNKLDYSLFTLARFVQQALPQSTTFDLWLLILVNLEISHGNVCMNVDEVYTKSVQLGWTDFPQGQECLQRIQSSVLIGKGDDDKPLVFDLNKLYLNRYYFYEQGIVERLMQLSRVNEIPDKKTMQAIDRVFPESDQTDYQKLAAIVSCRHRLCIISGGPGTGKTWTVSKILALLIMQEPDIKIRLAAPTGKAAARLSQSIIQLQQSLALDEDVKQHMPQQAVTLHRLLGIHRYSHQARFNLSSPIDCDVVILDEASMIDQQLMAQLCNALPSQARLILLGDKDQLSSVEAGSVFAELCGGLSQTSFSAQQSAWCKQHWGFEIPEYPQPFALTDQVVVLHKSHRFDDRSPIGQLARWVRQGDSEQSLLLLKQTEHAPSLIWRQVVASHITPQLREQALPMALAMHRADTIQQAFAGFHQYQILCAVWKGAAGVDGINEQLEQALKQNQSLAGETEFYAGKPLMMTSNAYQFDIHNGDIGIIWPDDNGDLKVWFELGAGEYRQLSLSQCPRHKTAYAMTVHKSQGSEFNKVLLILPSSEVAVSTRELFYTGITRASESVEIWASEERIRSTIELKTQRVSGLMQRLQESA
jgi:exodeoxyribonuclease V alpha subunit